jgi:branched-chain amino acid transport system substrate-binding protein
MRFHRRATALVAGLASVIALGACGSSNNDNTSSSSGATPAATTKAAAGNKPTQATIDFGLKLTGGKAGAADASAKPFVVGFVNQEGGSASSYPEMTPGAQAAVKFINEQLGGMAGRPLKLDTCIIQAEEDGQKCAAQFLNNKDVMSVEYGLTVVGNTPFHTTVAGKLPIIAAWPGGPADYTTPGVRMLNGGALATISAMTADVVKSGAKSLSVVSSPNPAGKFVSEQIIKPEMSKAGVKTTIVYVPDAGTAPDYVSALQASGGSKSDVIMSIPASADVCVYLYDALKTLAIHPKKVVATYYCYGDPIPEKTGGGPKGWDFFGPDQNQRIASPEQAVFLDAMKTYTDNKLTNVGAPQSTFGDLLTLAKFANAVGPDITRQQITEQLLAFRGHKFMVDGTMQCDSFPTFIGACGDSSSGSTYDGSKYVSLGAFKVNKLLDTPLKETTSANKPLPVPVVPKAAG